MEPLLPPATSLAFSGAPRPWREATSNTPQQPFWAKLRSSGATGLVQQVHVEEEGGMLTIARGPRRFSTLWGLLALVLAALLSSFASRWSCLSTVEEYATTLASLEHEESVTPRAHLEAEIAQMQADPPRCNLCLPHFRATGILFIPTLLGIYAFVFLSIIAMTFLTASVQAWCSTQELPMLRITPEQWWVKTAAGSHTGLTSDLAGAKVRQTLLPLPQSIEFAAAVHRATLPRGLQVCSLSCVCCSRGAASRPAWPAR